ncbi:hypothetical protein QX776_11290 [Alteromonadaceae bacterium BrNp21-10]|nr:hypothetical protein [Alteromonadaceae bacterium BrNp21-10]
MWLRRIIFHLGGNPHRSWRYFIVGALLFSLGIYILLYLNSSLLWLQYLGLGLLGSGLIVAIKGYVGIFANRFAQVLNRAKPPPEL